MSDENPVDLNTDDLDSFSDEFFGQNKSSEPASSEAEVVKEDSDASIEDANLEQTHDADTEQEESDDEEPDDTDDKSDSEPEPSSKKTRLDKRIGGLLEEKRIEKERADALEARLNDVLQRLEKNTEPTTPTVEVNGPTPDDKLPDGTDKYPLGEFDAQYLADKVKHDFNAQWAAKEAEAEAQRESQKVAEAQKALDAEWSSKMVPAQERYPDFQEKGQALVSTFDGLEPNYSLYLTQTLQSMEYGPDVLYYLSTNLPEARRIVNLGPAGATLALGRIESKFAFAEEEKQKARPKVSKAPTPPPTNKGAAVSVNEVPDDTDDLDAFALKLFKTKR